MAFMAFNPSNPSIITQMLIWQGFICGKGQYSTLQMPLNQPFKFNNCGYGLLTKCNCLLKQRREMSF